MKKEYFRPEMTVSLFDTKDVITASESQTTTMTKDDGTLSIGTGGSASVDFKYGE